MQVPEAIPWLSEYVGPVNATLEELHPSGGATDLERAVAYTLSNGGKRVRATLALLWCEMFSGDFRAAVPLAAAYELAHASALVQDDIIDGSGMRRGRESTVVKYGLATAVLASDLLLFNIPKLFTKYGYLRSERLVKIFDLLGEASRASTWGEYLDLELTRDAGTESEYEEMMREKTSSLLSAPCGSGALVGGASDEDADTAAKFGEELGIAYQIQDDTLDLIGEEALLGKPVMTDLRGGKKSLVVVHCLSRCSSGEREFIYGLVGRSGNYAEAEISKLRLILEKCGSLEYARGKVAKHTQDARAVLDQFPKSDARSRLLELTGYLAARYY